MGSVAEFAKPYQLLDKLVKENPQKHVAVSDTNDVILADGIEELLEIAKNRKIKILCIGRGRKFSHYLYEV